MSGNGVGPAVYVAGRTRDVERVRRVQQMVRDVGGSITFDWTGSEGEIRKSWSEAPDRARELSERERAAVWDADITILMCHPEPGGVGCFVEVGIAMGHDSWVWVVEPPRDSVFYYLSCVTLVDNEAVLPHLLRAWRGQFLSEDPSPPVATAAERSCETEEEG